MSGSYFQPSTSAEEDEYNSTPAFTSHTPQHNQTIPFLHPEIPSPSMAQHELYYNTLYQPPSQHPPNVPNFHSPPSQYIQHPLVWPPQGPIVPSNPVFPSQSTTPFPPFNPSLDLSRTQAGPSNNIMPLGYISPGEPGHPRMSRTTSFTSNASSMHSVSRSGGSRSVSPNANEMSKWGYMNEIGSWSCSYPGCTSNSVFKRGCDLRKHYKRHSKTLFCRVEGCPSSTEGGFSSKKDRIRHEAKHNPTIFCEWEGCGRLFSRQDNMKDHVRRMHKPRVT